MQRLRAAFVRINRRNVVLLSRSKTEIRPSLVILAGRSYRICRAWREVDQRSLWLLGEHFGCGFPFVGSRAFSETDAIMVHALH